MIFPSIPATEYASDAATLLEWMGSFWTQTYRDHAFLSGVQGSRAMLSAQVYLGILESAGLLNRQLLPVLHRERWYPLVVKRSQVNTGNAAAPTLGMEPAPVLGPQTGAGFPSNLVFNLGGDVSYTTIVTYPIAPTPVSVLTCIVDNILAPKVILQHNQDFTVQDSTLIIRKEYDPFGSDSVFPTNQILTDGQQDLEVVLWGCDVMFDLNYVNNYLGYCVGITGPATEQFKRVVNSSWDMVTSGALPVLFSATLGAICRVPVVQQNGEVVEAITIDQNGDQLVITDHTVYRLPDVAELNPSVVVGAVLQFGDFLDNSIRIYQNMQDPAKIQAMPYGVDLRSDIPAVSFPPSFFRAPLQFGLSASWELVPISCAGLDLNGNPKLWFPLGGSSQDVTAFWADIWSRAESAGISLVPCFAGYLDDIVIYESGSTVGSVEPLGYFLKNLVGANTILVSLAPGRMWPTARQQLIPAFVDMLQRTLPSASWLFCVERRSAEEQYDLVDSTANEIGSSHWLKTGNSSAVAGGPSPVGLRYQDRPVVKRWVAQCS